jgi:hypothetical protein
MKAPIPISPPDLVMPDEHESNLIRVLSDPRGEEFFGPAFARKAAVLAELLTGNDSPSAIAKKLGLSRQLVHWHAVRARKIYMRRR